MPELIAEVTLADGPVAEVGTTEQHVTIKFDWHHGQRFFLTPDEARAVSQALAVASVLVDNAL